MAPQRVSEGTVDVDAKLGIEMAPRVPVTPEHLRAAAAFCRASLTPVQEDDWTVPAGDLEWSCRRTLDHLIDVFLFYAGHLATRAPGRLTHLRDGDRARSPSELLIAAEAAAAVLAEVAAAAPTGARGYHPAGMADAEGFLAMGCVETLVHTYDIASGLDRAARPPDDLVAPVIARLFPWIDSVDDPWHTFLWATGRVALPDRPRLDADWYWHCAPLDEWDGTVKRRTAPPGWV